MWLLVDIGNSSSKVGLFNEALDSEPGLRSESVTRFEHGETPEGILHLHAQLAHYLNGVDVTRVGAVSVVPSASLVWSRVINTLLRQEITFFDETSPMPIRLTYQTPQTMGKDRIVAAVAGWSRFASEGEKGVIVVDAGTAINYEVVLPDGEYPGGVIAPGPGLVRQALGSGTAQLPKVELEMPPLRIGRTTDEAIRSGIMFGMEDGVRSMVHALMEETNQPMEVVLTGGWGKWLSVQTGWVYNPDLVLLGVADLMAFEGGPVAGV